MAPRIKYRWIQAILVVYHVPFCFLCWAFYQCIMTDPGVVPPNWGFYMGDETKRRRYCKMCNVWKPDRTHHCSICNRCILNMDHHCPWINNCVGFYNRKFFIQLLLYTYTCLIICITASLYDVFRRIQTIAYLFSDKDMIPRHMHSVDWTYPVVFSSFTLAVLLIIMLTNFIRFHMKLVLDNFTTIENLEREENAKSKFDIGSRRNWEQVFGSFCQLWWLPVHVSASRPVGDGVRWRVHYTRVIDEDEELPSDEAASGTRFPRDKRWTLALADKLVNLVKLKFCRLGSTREWHHLYKIFPLKCARGRSVLFF